MKDIPNFDLILEELDKIDLLNCDDDFDIIEYILNKIKEQENNISK